MVRLWSKTFLRILYGMLIVALVTVIAYTCHAKSFVAGFLYLFPITLIAFWWGLVEASVASVVAVGCLDFFFTEPRFHFYMSDPQDWIALISFEAIVLIVSRLADRLKCQAIEADNQRRQIERLYLMTRDILLLDRRVRTGTQLVRLIANIFSLDGVSLWDAREVCFDSAGTHCIPEEEVKAAYFRRQHQHNKNDGRYTRALFIGSRPIGGIGLSGVSARSPIDIQVADAIASLAALALERSHSFKSESSAEAAHQSEQLRSAVLDGLAHAFKTPLTTILAASSGMLEMNTLTFAQKELLTSINEEVIRLGQLTTQMLQTARMDESQLIVKRGRMNINYFLQILLEETAQNIPLDRMRVLNEAANEYVWGDSRLLQMALLEFIDNAAKYADPASTITLHVAMTDAEVTFSVHNRGSYVAPTESAKIFRRFYRSPGSEYRAAGTGLGLSFVKQIADAHEGSVWVNSDPVSGTVFFFRLPRICAEN